MVGLPSWLAERVLSTFGEWQPASLNSSIPWFSCRSFAHRPETDWRCLVGIVVDSTAFASTINIGSAFSGLQTVRTKSRSSITIEDPTP